MKFEHIAVVQGDPDKVFTLTQDYSRRLSWDPFLRHAELVGGAIAPGVGVRAWCVAWSGVGMETEYVSFAPPRIAAVKMTSGPWLLESFGGAWEFRAAGSNRTSVTFRYQFRTRPRWLAWLLEPLARRWFSWETRKRVLALETALQKPAVTHKRNFSRPIP
jgi:ribosome-associated toxin RatA of RatAB toxin-antitoxin module